MKILIALLCTFSILRAAPSDEIKDELQKTPTDAHSAEELAWLETIPLIQQPITSQDLQLPAPAFEPRPHKSAFLAVSMSTLFPGLGHVYLGDMKTAGGLMGTTGLGIGTAALFHSKEALMTSLLAVQNTWFYGIYAAYRDVRMYNGQAGYSYKMPTDSLFDLTTAPFRWSVLKKPEVWGGLLGSFAVLVSAAYLAFPQDKEAHIRPALSVKRAFTPLVAFPVGVGEESFFRGYLQSQLSEALTPWGGIALSSLLFGAVHIPNGMALEPQNRRGYYTFIVPLITAFGAYEGWVTYKNHSLRESVALHTWYDFVLFTISSLAGQAAITGHADFAISIPF